MAFYVDPERVCIHCKECACYSECYYDLDVKFCEPFYYDCEFCPRDSCFIPSSDSSDSDY